MSADRPRAERFLDWSEEYYFEHQYPTDRPCLSQSLAGVLRTCPAEAAARHPLIGANPYGTLKKRTTKATTIGVGVEQFLLSDGKGLARIPFDDFKKKAARESRDEAIDSGLLPITTKMYDEVLAVAKVAMAKLQAGCEQWAPIRLNGDSQVVYVWPHETEYGTIWCRGKMDHVKTMMITGHPKVVIYDLKTTRHASHDKFARSVIDYGYHIQGAAYEDAARAFHGEPLMQRPVSVEYYLILVEPGSANINVTVRPFSADMQLIGENRWNESCELWGKCIAESRWPNYTEDEQDGPQWYMGKYFDLLKER